MVRSSVVLSWVIQSSVGQSAIGESLWACFSGIDHFCFMLQDWHCTIYTDHRPLTFALRWSSDPYNWSARQCRQLVYITEFTSDIRHITGASSPGLLYLSLSRQLVTRGPSSLRISLSLYRHPRVTGGSVCRKVLLSCHQPSFRCGTGHKVISAHQKTCPAITWLAANPYLQVQPVFIRDASLLCDQATGTPCHLIP